jgi:hypothetical protein
MIFEQNFHNDGALWCSVVMAVLSVVWSASKRGRENFSKLKWRDFCGGGISPSSPFSYHVARSTFLPW